MFPDILVPRQLKNKNTNHENMSQLSRAINYCDPEVQTGVKHIWATTCHIYVRGRTDTGLLVRFASVINLNMCLSPYLILYGTWQWPRGKTHFFHHHCHSLSSDMIIWQGNHTLDDNGDNHHHYHHDPDPHHQRLGCMINLTGRVQRSSRFCHFHNCSCTPPLQTALLHQCKLLLYTWCTPGPVQTA